MTNTILIRMPNWLGDCVMSLPVLERVKTHAPEARILAACRPHLAPCYKAHPLVDETILCPGRSRGLAGLRHHWRHGASLRKNHIGTGILLTNSFSSAFWLWRTGAEKRVGFSRDGRSLFLTDKLLLTPDVAAAHQSLYYLYAADAAFGVPQLMEQPKQPKLYLPESPDLDRLYQSIGIADTPCCVMAPVSAYGAVKDWPGKHFASLAREIYTHHNLPVLISGVMDHKEACQEIADAGGEGVFNVAGQTDMTGFLHMIQKAALFVGNDSGGAHVAAACGVPTVVLFGITEPSRTRPLGPKVRILGKGGAVTPDLKDAAVRAEAKAALEAISMEAAMEAVQALAGPQEHL